MYDKGNGLCNEGREEVGEWGLDYFSGHYSSVESEKEDE